MYQMMYSWVPECSFWMNTYIFIGYIIIAITVLCQQEYMPRIERNKAAQICLIGVLYPALVAHTITGFIAYITANKESCRDVYKSDVAYIIVLMIALVMIVI